MKITYLTDDCIEWYANGIYYGIYSDGYSIADELIEFARAKKIDCSEVTDEDVNGEHYARGYEWNEFNILHDFTVAYEYLKSIEYKWVAYALETELNLYWSVIEYNGKYFLNTQGTSREITSYEFNELKKVKQCA